jgi:hypothetical protein
LAGAIFLRRIRFFAHGALVLFSMLERFCRIGDGAGAGAAA